MFKNVDGTAEVDLCRCLFSSAMASRSQSPLKSSFSWSSIVDDESVSE